MNTQLKRIQEMEKLLNESREALDAYDKALQDFKSVQEKIGKLEAYYTSKKWIKDFEDYEAGKIPKQLPCGVLSEDAVYNLLMENRDLILEIMDLMKEHIR